MMEVNQIQRELSGLLKEAKEQHSRRVREAFTNKSSKELWDYVKEMTNQTSAKKDMYAHNELDKANEFNCFYKRFDSDPVKNVNECRELLYSCV